MSTIYLGVDIGGTAVKLGLVDETGRVLRRAERSVVALNQVEPMNTRTIELLNRASDVFFIMARVLNQNAGQTETYWRGTSS